MTVTLSDTASPTAPPFVPGDDCTVPADGMNQILRLLDARKAYAGHEGHEKQRAVAYAALRKLPWIAQLAIERLHDLRERGIERGGLIA